MGGSGSLTRLYKNNSDLEGKKVVGRCPNSYFYGRCIVELDSGGFSEKLFFVRCKMWGCPVCNEVNGMVLRHRLRVAIEKMYDHMSSKSGFRADYWFKFLTLTVPGAGYRSEVSPDQAAEELKKNFSKLITALRKDDRTFEYFWVVEWHNGYPHMHVLLMGPGIAGKDVLNRIEVLWRIRYGMGFVMIKAMKNGYRGIVWYLTKYISKGLESGMKSHRVYSSSRLFGTLMKSDKKRFTVIEFGTFAEGPDGLVFTPLYKSPDDLLAVIAREAAFQEFSRQVDEVILLYNEGQESLW